MYTRLLLSFTVVTCVCFSSTLAQIQNPSAQKVPQTIQKPAAPSKVDAFLKILQNATTLEAVQNAFDGAGFSQAELDQLKTRTEGSAPLKQKLERLQNDARAAMRVQANQLKQQSASRTAALSTQLNQRRIADFKKRIVAIKAIDTKSLDPAVRCRADAPSITSVSPVTPAVEFAVEGMGFGEYPGTVEITTGGKVFSAHVTGWNSCTIYAELGDDVSGVRANPQASVSITTTAGKITRGLTSFTPTLETSEQTNGDITCGHFYFGNHENWTFWDYGLKNDWYVVGTSLEHKQYGHAEITSAPATNVPNGSAQTKVHAGVAGVACSRFIVTLSLAGPKGLPYN
jgi:hypothetical protein